MRDDDDAAETIDATDSGKQQSGKEGLPTNEQDGHVDRQVLN